MPENLPPSPSTPPPAEKPGTKLPFKFDFDTKTIETMKWGAIGYVVARLIDAASSYVAGFFLGGYLGAIASSLGVGTGGSLYVGSLIQNLIWSAVWGAVAGFVLAKFWPKILQIGKKFRLNNLFKIIFYPTVVGTILVFLLSFGAGFMIGIIPIIIICAGTVVGRYVLARLVVSKVGKYYPAA